MANIVALRGYVGRDYKRAYPSRDEFADWLYPHHVLVVAQYAREIAARHGVDPDLCEAAALLHDFADAYISRKSENHEAVSLDRARTALQVCGYDETVISKIVDDALRYHSCRGSDRPKSDEGKVLATADALAHFLTDFYPFIVGQWSRRPLEEVRSWVREKIERDYHTKIFYDDERAKVAETYQLLKKQFA